MTTKLKLKQRWMNEYDRLVVLKCPELAGKIDWDQATFFYNSGYTPLEASAKDTQQRTLRN